MQKPLNYTLLITADPYLDGILLNALKFAQALVKRGHSIQCVFFYHNASLTANAYANYPADETNPALLWQQFVREHQIACALCVSAGLRRGIGDASMINTLPPQQGNLLDGFAIRGLSDLMTAIAETDRFIQFGVTL